MAIILSTETETRLRARAAREGQKADALADALLADALTSDPDDLTNDEVAEIRAGLRRGIEAALAGRVTPLSKAVAEARRRHGFPATWAGGVDGNV